MTPQAPPRRAGGVGSRDANVDAAEERSVPRRAGPHRAQRVMSLLSQEAMNGLDMSSAEISGMEAQVDEIERALRAGDITCGQARSELAQVEANAHKVETNKIDCVYTSELTTGREEAKTAKKEQLQR